MITEEDQFAWLNGDGHDIDAQQRVNDDALRAKGGEKFHRLESHPLGPDTIRLARYYVQLTVPCPRATEMAFWAASAMPSTNASTAPRLVAISINKMETLVLGRIKDEPACTWGFVNVSKSSLVDAYGSIPDFARPRQDWLDVHESTYESGGDDVATIHTDHEGIVDLLAPEDDDFSVTLAARRLNLMLMRKGPTLQWRWHNFQLADRLVESIEESAAQ